MTFSVACFHFASAEAPAWKCCFAASWGAVGLSSFPPRVNICKRFLSRRHHRIV